jgi:uncharacterized protein YdeI (YjbR/CyaY-like superfamily)
MSLFFREIFEDDMPKTKHNPEAGKLIDEYISKAEPFARPICNKLRGLIFKAEPEMIEDWKWGPNYQKNGMVCGYGAFRQHVNFHFFNGALLKDAKKILTEGGSNMKSRGVKFRSADDIDDKVIILYIKEAVKLNETSAKLKKRELEVPAVLRKILNKNKVAGEIFNKLPYTHKKEYILWIEEAKKEETRERRLGRISEMLLAGKKEP